MTERIVWPRCMFDPNRVCDNKCQNSPGRLAIVLANLKISFLKENHSSDHADAAIETVYEQASGQSQYSARRCSGTKFEQN